MVSICMNKSSDRFWFKVFLSGKGGCHTYTQKKDNQCIEKDRSVSNLGKKQIFECVIFETLLYTFTHEIYPTFPRITKLGEFPRYVKSLRQGIALSNCYLSSNLLCIPKLITDYMSLHSIIKSSETTTNNLNCDFKGRSKMGFPVKNYFRNPDLSKKM